MCAPAEPFRDVGRYRTCRGTQVVAESAIAFELVACSYCYARRSELNSELITDQFINRSGTHAKETGNIAAMSGFAHHLVAPGRTWSHPVAPCRT